MNSACKICEKSHFKNLFFLWASSFCSAVMNPDHSCPFLLPSLEQLSIVSQFIIAVQGIQLSGAGGLTLPWCQGWNLLILQVKWVSWPQVLLLYIEILSVFSKWQCHGFLSVSCFIELFGNILSNFSWQKYNNVFTLVLSCGVKNFQINRKSLLHPYLQKVNLTILVM